MANLPAFSEPNNPPRAKIDSSSPQAFFNSLLPVAVAWGNANGISPQLLLAINASESGYGSTSTLFGIKGPGASYSTWEQGPNGERRNITDSFRTYKDPNDAYRDFFQFIQENSRYHDAWTRFKSTGDAEQLIKDINSAGYATDTRWAEKVINHSRQIARDYNLSPQPSLNSLPSLLSPAPANPPELQPGTPPYVPPPARTEEPQPSASQPTGPLPSTAPSPLPPIENQPGTGPWTPPTQTQPTTPSSPVPSSGSQPGVTVPSASSSPSAPVTSQSPTSPSPNGPSSNQAGMIPIAPIPLTLGQVLIQMLAQAPDKFMNYLNMAFMIDEHARNNENNRILNQQTNVLSTVIARSNAQSAYANAQHNLAVEELNRAKFINEVNTRNATRILPKGTEYFPGLGPDSLMAQAAGMLGVKYEPIKVSEVDRYKLDPVMNLKDANSTMNPQYRKLTPDDFGVKKFDDLQTTMENTQYIKPLAGPKELVQSLFGDSVADSVGLGRMATSDPPYTSAGTLPQLPATTGNGQPQRPTSFTGDTLPDPLKNLFGHALNTSTYQTPNQNNVNQKLRNIAEAKGIPYSD